MCRYFLRQTRGNTPGLLSFKSVAVEVLHKCPNKGIFNFLLTTILTNINLFQH